MQIGQRDFLSLPWISFLLAALGPGATLGDVARALRR